MCANVCVHVCVKVCVVRCIQSVTSNQNDTETLQK